MLVSRGLGEVYPIQIPEHDAKRLLAEARAGTLLAGVRGRPPGDVPALVHCLNSLADFAWAEREHIAEIDVNPIVVRERGRGCAVVDALIVPRGRLEEAGSPRR
jgi:acetate---CoA ligase (ADP-forming)